MFPKRPNPNDTGLWITIPTDPNASFGPLLTMLSINHQVVKLKFLLSFYAALTCSKIVLHVVQLVHRAYD